MARFALHDKIVAVGDKVKIHLLMSASRECRGIGNIVVNGILLRDGRFPLVPRIDTPDGYVYTQMFLDTIAKTGHRDVTIFFDIVGFPVGREEYLDEYNQPMVGVGQQRERVKDRLILHLRAEQLSLGKRQWNGFSYSFEFRSPRRRIHRLLVDGSWELRGSITGNTVLSQGQVNMPVYVGARNTLFTTACFKSLSLPGSPQNVSYQLGPRGALLQAFDFQYGKWGALLQYWPKMGAIHSILESPEGSTRLFVEDEYRFELACCAQTTPQHVLVTQGRILDHEGRDLWWAAREKVYSGMRAAFGLKPTVHVPQLGMHYTTHPVKKEPRITIAGQEVATREVPYVIADRVLPLLAKQGVSRFFPQPFSESDATVLGMQRKLDNGIHGELHCASVCATHRYLPADFWGGMKAWRYMANRGRELGIEIGCFFEPNLSPRAAILSEHPEYIMASNNSLPWSGGFGIQSLVALDWNTGVFDWMLADFKRWHDEGGIDFIDVMDAANFGLLGRNYAERMRTNFDALGRFYRALQSIGIPSLTFEGISPFGSCHFGAADRRTDLRSAGLPPSGQNDFGWWVGNEHMGIDISIGCKSRKRSEKELRCIQFKFMANRGTASFEDRIGDPYRLPPWWKNMNKIYLLALPHMKIRRMLPDNAGVRWEDGATQIYWTYKDIPIQLHPGSLIETLKENGSCSLPVNRDRIILPAFGVYRIYS